MNYINYIKKKNRFTAFFLTAAIIFLLIPSVITTAAAENIIYSEDENLLKSEYTAPDYYDYNYDYEYPQNYIEIETETKTETETQPEIEINIEKIINNSLIFKIENPKALINGEIKQIDANNPNIAPFIDENSRTLVPVRFIAESLGYDVFYDELERKVTVTDYYNIIIVMYIDIPVIEINGEIFDIDTAPKIISGGRTVIPLRAFVENGLKRKVNYIDSQKVIIISDFEINFDLANEISETAVNKLSGIKTTKTAKANVASSDSDNSENNSGGFNPIWPVPGSNTIASMQTYPQYSDLKGSAHIPGAPDDTYAIDIGNNGNFSTQKIVAIESGTVEEYGLAGSFGNRIVIRHDNGYLSVYAHLASFSDEIKTAFKNKTKIEKGTVIGIMGTTGYSYGVHLHFYVRDNNGDYITMFKTYYLSLEYNEENFPYNDFVYRADGMMKRNLKDEYQNIARENNKIIPDCVFWDA